MRAMILAVSVAATAACSEPSGLEAMLLMTVIVDDTAYHPAAELDPATQEVGAEYTRVTRFVDCSDGVWLENGTHVSDYCPLEDGESNYLPTGTVVYRLVGVDPADGLTARHAGVWNVLRPAQWNPEE